MMSLSNIYELDVNSKLLKVWEFIHQATMAVKYTIGALVVAGAFALGVYGYNQNREDIDELKKSSLVQAKEIGELKDKLGVLENNFSQLGKTLEDKLNVVGLYPYTDGHVVYNKVEDQGIEGMVYSYDMDTQTVTILPLGEYSREILSGLENNPNFCPEELNRMMINRFFKDVGHQDYLKQYNSLYERNCNEGE